MGGTALGGMATLVLGAMDSEVTTNRPHPI